jgi:hypothetical protein
MLSQEYNDYKLKQAITKAERIYKEIAEDDRSLSEDFLSICAESVSKYKTVRKTGKNEAAQKG